MRLSRRSKRCCSASRSAVGLAFIYIPLIVIVIYAFNSSKILEWPPPGLTLEWFPKAFESESVREALLTSIKAGLAATAIALVLGTLASLAVAALPLLRPRDDLLPGDPADRPARDRHRRRAQQHLHPGARRRRSACFTVIVGHATFCIVVVYNNVVARLRRVSGSFEEASADLGAHTWQTFRFVTLPEHEDRPGRRRPARLRPLLRRDHRHHVHDRRRRRNPADLDLLQPLPPQRTADRQRRRRDRRS